MVTQRMANDALKVVEEEINEEFVESADESVTLDSSNSTITFVPDGDDPYFTVCVFGTEVTDADGVYTVSWDDTASELAIGNQMYVLDPDEWNTDEDEEVYAAEVQPVLSTPSVSSPYHYEESWIRRFWRDMTGF